MKTQRWQRAEGGRTVRSVLEMATTNAGQVTVTLPVAPGNKFYRLRKP